MAERSVERRKLAMHEDARVAHVAANGVQGVHIVAGEGLLPRQRDREVVECDEHTGRRQARRRMLVARAVAARTTRSHTGFQVLGFRF